MFSLMRYLRPGVFIASLLAIAGPAIAQSANTASLSIVVLDQQDKTVAGAVVSVVNNETGARREVTSGADGTATVVALSITGSYTVSVAKPGFTSEDVKNLRLSAGEIATVKVKLLAAGGRSEVTVYGTTEGVRSNPQIGVRLSSQVIDETPLLGRKVTSLPLLNSAFRQGKGTGDLFVNATYFVTASGSRRTTTFMLDGASNDEGWGRQTALITVPVGSVQEANVLTNAFSSEFGWTSGPAMNIVTKAGTNSLHGDALYMGRPGGMQAELYGTKGFCPPSITTCVTPATLESITPVDIPDELNQFSGSVGGAIKRDQTFFFAAGDYTAQHRTTALSPTLPAYVLDNGSLTYVGEYRQKLFDARVDHKLSPSQNLMFRFNLDHMFDTNPNDTVIGTTAPTAARRYTRRGWSTQVNHTLVLTGTLLNEARFAWTNGDPVTLWEAVESGTIYQRTAGASPFRIGANQYSNLYSRQATFSDTLSWSRGKHYVRFGGSLARHMTGGTGNEPGQALGGTFTFVGTGPSASLPPDQLTIADVQNYSQPFSFGAPTSYTLNQWLGSAFIQDSFRARKDLTLELGLRYDRQSLTDSTKNFAPRLGFGWHPGGDSRLAIRGGYGLYFTQVRTNSVAGAIMNGLDGFTTYTATPGQAGFPECLTCVPVSFTGNPATAPAKNITIVAGRREFYTQQFAQYGLNFDLLPNYPDEFLNPHSQVTSIGAEREVFHGFFAGADYVHQTWSNLDRSVDLNAPSIFDRTAPGQVRTVANANATRPILPATGGVTAVNTIMNLGVADYDGLQTMFSYRGHPKLFASLSYTLSKATNTTEPDGNGIGPNENILARLDETERGPSLLDQRHRAVISVNYQLPFNHTAGILAMVASARPVNATTGVDNNGDGSTNDRPVIDGHVVSKSPFRGTGTQDVSFFLEGRVKFSGKSVLLRFEGFNVLNHPNLLARGVTTYGDGAAAAPTFGQFAGNATTTAIPAFANIDPPRMFQFQARFVF
jgi:hypothetical protein